MFCDAVASAVVVPNQRIDCCTHAPVSKSTATLRSIENIDSIGRPEGSVETFRFVLDFILRRYREIAIAAVIAGSLGFFYVLTATPSYTATATMIIDLNKVQLFQQQIDV